MADAAAGAGLGEDRDLGGRFAIEVAPTPELDDVFRSFLEHGGQQESDSSYFEGGRVSEPAVARMFRAAALLYRTAPWKLASDGDVLRMDIPTLGVEGAQVDLLLRGMENREERMDQTPFDFRPLRRELGLDV